MFYYICFKTVFIFIPFRYWDQFFIDFLVRPNKQKMNYIVINNTASDRFELKVNGVTAFVKYRLHKNIITFTHMLVPHQLKGEGIGSVLAKYVLDYATEKHLTVIPDCPFIRDYIEWHQEYLPLVNTWQ
jgi:predicted GNAT family acetyltransferase